MTLPRVWQGVGYRPLPDAETARPLFDFAAVPWPGGSARVGRADAPARPQDGSVLVWGAFSKEGSPAGAEGLVGAVIGERAGAELILHGPVVDAERRADAPVPREDAREHAPLEVAAQLIAAALDHATALGVETVFARPQGLDRVWVRFGFIPVPESALPERLAGHPGAGLYAWRGGSALWTFRERRADAPERRADAPERRADAPERRAEAPAPPAGRL